MSKTRSSIRVQSPTLARLPPLASLRAFVAAARHLSFTRAAEELHVSPAAVGQQIRILEDYLGEQLFHRSSSQLRLSAAGRVLMPGLTEAFDGVLEAVAQLAHGVRDEPIRVSVAPSFASKWLVSRLERLRLAVPDLRVQVNASASLVDVEREDVDCVIRYGNGAYPGLYVERLFSEVVAPVCSPAFAESYDLRPRQRTLRGVPLLHEEGPEHDTSCPNWNGWLRAQGLSARFLDSGFRLNQSSLVLEAAAAGQGLGLGKLRLAAADIAAGRLIVPFGRPQAVAFSYFFVAAPRKVKIAQVELFLRWLRIEAQLVTDITKLFPLPAAE
ncbi:LysR substrate-binding domain-containing protein [Mesorhizobium sp. DCY119]|uniref:LysR substrate-binding domain-containing protein n=1 Tax=Mesorhizobium sp. DCY119 TaxID=2108445 RepID=UPI000E75B03C|nr:LysR substrate-binding domain-containing protein [Mesorhizobium sp. DCY119]RJG40510.1 LysR family transcriptional regulator [Mesorhizobium sp. DCY119]